MGGQKCKKNEYYKCIYIIKTLKKIWRRDGTKKNDKENQS